MHPRSSRMNPAANAAAAAGRKSKFSVVLVAYWITLVIAVTRLATFATAFTPIPINPSGGGSSSSSGSSDANWERRISNEFGTKNHQRHSVFLSPKDINHARVDDKSPSEHPMTDTSFLSHVMLKVPSVGETVAYWTQKGGNIRMSRPKDAEATNGNVELMSAFVELGYAKGSASRENESSASASPPVCFALELVSTSKSPDSYSIGNAISYIGVSMLLQFQNNLLGAITGLETPESQGDEPNGIRVQSAASAPGDFLARLALKSNNLEATHKFYTSVLGMEVKAEDETMLCLRYDNECFSGGVPTTLVFDASKGEIDVGDCFDHFVIATNAPVENLHSRFLEDEQCKKNIFMKPTEMFGKQVMGMIDPNGYKVIIAST